MVSRCQWLQWEYLKWECLKWEWILWDNISSNNKLMFSLKTEFMKKENITITTTIITTVTSFIET
jgi:hypothetical protein